MTGDTRASKAPWGRRRKIALALAVIFGGAGIILFIVAFARGGGHTHTVLAPIGALLLVLGFPALLEAITEPTRAQSAEDRVERLVSALRESTAVIREIEQEIESRSELASRLTADIERHRELLKLDQEEVEAVAQTFRTEVRAESRRSLFFNVLVGAVFFGLGVVVTLALR